MEFKKKDILKKTKAALHRRGVSNDNANTMQELMKTTCVACKHAAGCREKGIAKHPFQEKCDRWEMSDTTNLNRSLN